MEKELQQSWTKFDTKELRRAIAINMAAFMVVLSLLQLLPVGQGAATSKAKSVTVIGHVFCEQCSEKAGLLPDVMVSIQCKSRGQGDYYHYSAMRTTDLNGAFMASIPVEQLPDHGDFTELCSARVLGGPIEVLTSTAADQEVGFTLKSSKDGHFVYSAGALLYRPEHAFKE